MAAKVTTKQKTIEVPSVVKWIAENLSDKPAGYMTLHEMAANAGISVKALDARFRSAQERCSLDGIVGPYDMRLRCQASGRFAWCYPCPELAADKDKARPGGKAGG